MSAAPTKVAPAVTATATKAAAPATGAAEASVKAENADGKEAGKEEEIDELDDPLLDISEEEIETDNVLVCQYDKVRRVKAKWSCSLKDGVVRLHGADHLFREAKCEFHF